MAFLLIIKQFGHCLQCLPECISNWAFFLSLRPLIVCVCGLVGVLSVVYGKLELCHQSENFRIYRTFTENKNQNAMIKHKL